MRKLFFLLVLLCTSQIGLSQAFENEKVTLKYYKPSFIEEAVPETFSVVVHETKNGTTTTTNAKDGGSENEQYYFNKYKGALKGSTCVSEGGAFTLNVYYGEPKLVKSTAEKYDLKDANGVVTGSAWRIKMEIDQERSFTLVNGSGKEIYKREMNGLGYHNHSTDAARNKFKSKDAAETDFETRSAGSIDQYQNWQHRSMGQAIKNTLKMDLKESNEKWDLNVVVLDVGKKEKDKYADVMALTDRMLAAFEKVNAEAKSGTKMNWHTAELKKEFEAIAAGFNKVMEDEIKNEENGLPARFEPVVLGGLMKNLLWCEFFASNYPVVEEWAEKFRNADEETTQTGAAVFNDLRISWNKITFRTPQYMAVYNNCKTKMNWQ